MTISLNVELPETVAIELTKYIETHQGWSQERALQAAVSLFLLQNGSSNGAVSNAYLDSLFGCAA